MAGVVDGVFPGWQWRPVNPGTRSERGEEWQPYNTTLPPCSEYTTICSKMPGIPLILLLVLSKNLTKILFDVKSLLCLCYYELNVPMVLITHSSLQIHFTTN